MVAIVAIGFLIVILFTSHKNSKPKKSDIDIEILEKQKQLSMLDNQIENKTIDRSVGLRKLEVKVLDMYDQSGIRVPADIIEDLNYMNLETEEEIFKYIENQRYYWKLENTKKPYKG